MAGKGELFFNSISAPFTGLGVAGFSPCVAQAGRSSKPRERGWEFKGAQSVHPVVNDRAKTAARPRAVHGPGGVDSEVTWALQVEGVFR